MMAAGGGSPLEAPAAGTAYRQRPASRWHWMPLRMALVAGCCLWAGACARRQTPMPTERVVRAVNPAFRARLYAAAHARIPAAPAVISITRRASGCRGTMLPLRARLTLGPLCRPWQALWHAAVSGPPVAPGRYSALFCHRVIFRDGAVRVIAMTFIGCRLRPPATLCLRVWCVGRGVRRGTRPSIVHVTARTSLPRGIRLLKLYAAKPLNRGCTRLRIPVLLNGRSGWLDVRLSGRGRTLYAQLLLGRSFFGSAAYFWNRNCLTNRVAWRRDGRGAAAMPAPSRTRASVKPDKPAPGPGNGFVARGPRMGRGDQCGGRRIDVPYSPTWFGPVRCRAHAGRYSLMGGHQRLPIRWGRRAGFWHNHAIIWARVVGGYRWRRGKPLAHIHRVLRVLRAWPDRLFPPTTGVEVLYDRKPGDQIIPAPFWLSGGKPFVMCVRHDRHGDCRVSGRAFYAFMPSGQPIYPLLGRGSSRVYRRIIRRAREFAAGRAGARAHREPRQKGAAGKATAARDGKFDHGGATGNGFGGLYRKAGIAEGTTGPSRLAQRAWRRRDSRGCRVAGAQMCRRARARGTPAAGSKTQCAYERARNQKIPNQ